MKISSSKWRKFLGDLAVLLLVLFNGQEFLDTAGTAVAVMQQVG